VTGSGNAGRLATTHDPGFAERLIAALGTLPSGLRTRFAPAPTGYLHLGHVANALVVWGVAGARAGTVVLRIEDHDRGRCRPGFETALLEDLDALGFTPDEPPIAQLRGGAPSPWRQRDNDRAYAAAAADLTERGLVYACDCSRSTFAAWAAGHGRAWTGSGCPGGCAGRGLPLAPSGVGWRVGLGAGEEAWADLGLGPQSGEPSASADLLVRDRDGNWTYALCVVVDDLRHDIDLVIRGADLTDATASQIRLGRLLGRRTPPRFLHHPLVRRPDGRKLSKADGSTAVRDLLAAGSTPGQLRERAAIAIGLPAELARRM
jgi:glutamyl/glutaminyl-tRNA synthetase